MDTASLRAQLTEVLRSVNDQRAPALLEPMLHSRDVLRALTADKTCRDLLSQIASFFKDAEPRYRALKLIQKGLRDFDINNAKAKVAKSLHDVKGNFLWCQNKCAELFQMDVHSLREENLFELMDAESQTQLSSTFGSQLFSVEDLKSVVISFTVKGVRLVSRCTPVYYTNCKSSSRFGIYMETRHSTRHSVVFRETFVPSSGSSFIESALLPIQMTPSFLTLTGSDLLQTPLGDFRRGLLTPSPLSIWQRHSEDKEEVSLSSFSITPLLLDEDPAPEKKQKIMEIREFAP